VQDLHKKNNFLFIFSNIFKRKEVSQMELKELVLEVEELEEKIAPASGSVGGQ